MPSLASLGLAVAPLVEPAAYPGRPAPFSAVQVGEWLYPWHSEDGGRRPVTIDGGPLLAAFAPGASVGVERVLAALGVAPMNRRQPVVAVGSNASPAQLYAKAGGPAAPVVPLGWVTVAGLTVGHSAHVSVAGYVPFAPAAGPPGRRGRFLAAWLDEAELDRLDVTEPNYRRSQLAPGSGPGPAWALYRGRRGLLRVPGRAPLGAGPQAAAWAELAANPRFAELFPAPPPAQHRLGAPDEGPWTPVIAAAMAADPERRAELNRRLRAEGWSADDGLDDLLGAAAPRTACAPRSSSQGADLHEQA